jgi:hypothetical protein
MPSARRPDFALQGAGVPGDDALEQELEDFVADCYADPLQFVRGAYPWGEEGTTLQDEPGPDVWQVGFLEELGQEVRARGFDGRAAVMPIRMACSKGHGVGGSTLAAWLVDWLMATRPRCHGTVTANTVTQLETKTWAAVQRWTRLCLVGHWFVINSARMYHPAAKDDWFCTPQTCRAENSEAFAGQHAKSSSSWYVFDEDSAVPEIIHTVSDGGITDGEPMQFRFGNPTRNTGSFYEAIFGKLRDRWRSVIVDSRTSKFANQELIAEWLNDYGEDSDFFRVRVRGLPPRASDAQFIDSQRIWEAQKRHANPLANEPLVAGVDVPDKGPAWFVCRFRRGSDARSIPPIRLPGDASPGFRDKLIAKLADRLAAQAKEEKIAAMFVDSAFGAPIVERLHVLGYENVHEIRFGGESPDDDYANMRAYMWGRMKDWLPNGAIETSATPGGVRLESDLAAPGYHLNQKDRIVLESKESMAKRGVASPDDGDALALTFARRVAPAVTSTGSGSRRPRPRRSGWG